MPPPAGWQRRHGPVSPRRHPVEHDRRATFGIGWQSANRSYLVAMTTLTVRHDGSCPLCRAEVALLRPLGRAARSPVVLALPERLYRAFLRVRPRLRRLAGGPVAA